MSLGVFSEGPFRARVSAAIEAAKKVLDNERSPSFPADVPHEYVDKVSNYYLRKIAVLGHSGTVHFFSNDTSLACPGKRCQITIELFI